MSRSDKIRAVAQQAHDNGDCVCCLPDEMVEFERAKQDTIAITLDRAVAEFYAKPAAVLELLHPDLVPLNQACQAALEQDTITITISREEAESILAALDSRGWSKDDVFKRLIQIVDGNDSRCY